MARFSLGSLRLGKWIYRMKRSPDRIQKPIKPKDFPIPQIKEQSWMWKPPGLRAFCSFLKFKRDQQTRKELESFRSLAGMPINYGKALL